MTNDEADGSIRHSDFVIDSDFWFRHLDFPHDFFRQLPLLYGFFPLTGSYPGQQRPDFLPLWVRDDEGDDDFDFVGMTRDAATGAPSADHDGSRVEEFNRTRVRAVRRPAGATGGSVATPSGETDR